MEMGEVKRVECSRATLADVPGIGRLFLASFPESIRHTCGTIPNFRAIEDLFTCIYEAEPRAVFVAKDASGQVAGYVLAPAKISNLWKCAVFGGHIFRWAWRWLKGDYGFGLYPIKVMALNKLGFLRSAFSAQISAEARILSVAVNPSLRGQGVATKLMSCALEYFVEQKAPLIRLEVRPDNLPAKKIYENLGFRAAGYTQDSQGVWLIMLKEMEH
jgi:ribosomal protein S18 acetylase RimI-like enzyme